MAAAALTTSESESILGGLNDNDTVRVMHFQTNSRAVDSTCSACPEPLPVPAARGAERVRGAALDDANKEGSLMDEWKGVLVPLEHQTKKVF